jgi:hypothetical protein
MKAAIRFLLAFVFAAFAVYCLVQYNDVQTNHRGDPAYYPERGLIFAVGAGFIAVFLFCFGLLAVARSRNSASAPSVADEIGKLTRLRDAGSITADEFEAQKSRLLGRA